MCDPAAVGCCYLRFVSIFLNRRRKLLRSFPSFGFLPRRLKQINEGMNRWMLSPSDREHFITICTCTNRYCMYSYVLLATVVHLRYQETMTKWTRPEKKKLTRPPHPPYPANLYFIAKIQVPPISMSSLDWRLLRTIYPFHATPLTVCLGGIARTPFSNYNGIFVTSPSTSSTNHQSPANHHHSIIPFAAKVFIKYSWSDQSRHSSSVTKKMMISSLGSNQQHHSERISKINQQETLMIHDQSWINITTRSKLTRTWSKNTNSILHPRPLSIT